MSTLNVEAISHPTSGSLVTINGTAPSNRNLVINGAMQVAQRGTSSTDGNYGTVDRFKVNNNGGSITQSQESLSSGDPYDEGFRNFYRCTNSTTATAAGNYKIITQFVESQNMANSGWNYTSTSSHVTLSFWARASVGQDYTFYCRNADGTAQNYSFTFTLAADTWTKVTHTLPGATGIQFDDDNGSGLQLTWAPWLGTNYTTSGHTDETWATLDSSSISKDMTTTWGSTTDATFDLTGVQLEVGSVATPFEHRSFGDELLRCQRYYEKSYAYATAPGAATRVGMVPLSGSNSSSCAGHIFRVAKRANPTIVLMDDAGTAGTVESFASGASLGSGSAAAQDITEKGWRYIDGISTTAEISHQCQFTADAEL